MGKALMIVDNLRNLNISEEMSAIAARHTGMLADATRFQLSDGKNREGGYLPRYIDDPYFSSIEGALAYQQWKTGISPGDNKPEDVMDFFIRGDFYDTIDVRVSGNQIDTFSWSNIASDVMAKTNNKAFGINPESAARLWNAVFRPALLKVIRAKMSGQ